MKHNVDYSTIDLIGRSSELGNHHQKYIYNIERNFDALVSLIDQKGLVERIRLLRFSQNPRKAMKLISGYLGDRDTLLNMLGCYYSIQYLVMNFKALDVLSLDLFTAVSDKYDAFSAFLTRTGNDFRLLSGAYMDTLMDVFLPGEDRPNFVVCSVGTRVDQEDIDIGIIDRGTRDRDKLTSAFAALNTQMLKNASQLHFHLSEHVGGRGYSASIDEYHELLDDKIGNFVLLNEMLNSVPVFGDFNLFEEYQKEILQRYYYHIGRDNRYHEGYLRGLLGEIHDLIMQVPLEDVLNPKKDALRMIKAVAFALKTEQGIADNTTLDVLGTLKKAGHPADIENYNRLYKSLTFFETFRTLYQLFVVQEEEIVLDRDIKDTLEPVALAMGYENRPYAKASTQLLIHYEDHLKIAQTGAQNIVQNITRHLGRITVFYSLTNPKKRIQSNTPYTGNVAVDFINELKFFSGTRFWNDFLISLDSQDEKLLTRFLKDFHKLKADERHDLIKQYIHWGKASPYTLISLLTIIKEHKSEFKESTLINEFLYEFIHSIRNTLHDVGRISKVFDYYPRKMYNFIALLSEELLNRLISILEVPVMNDEVDKTRKKLLAICQLQLNSSYYFKRFVLRVFNAYPDYIISFNNPKKFRQLSEGLFRNIDNFDTTEEKIDKLGSYYDFEFMRLGINMINGADFATINREFTIFSDNYLQVLFELSKQEVTREVGKEVFSKDLLAIFAAGGHARSQAFDDDYDLIILLNSEDDEVREFANKIIVKMNKNIIRRSIMPHYRFADRFGDYVTTFSELIDFFNDPDEDAFIDKSQLLGARMIVGSAHFKENFIKDIINPFVFDKRGCFINAVTTEIKSRYEYHKTIRALDIKESPGGLRDLENFLFILKAHFGLSEPVSPSLFSTLGRLIPDHSDSFKKLSRDYYFLKHVRDLYHLMVSDDDELQVEYLDCIVTPLMKSCDKSITSVNEIEVRLALALDNNVHHIETVINAVGYPFKY